MLNFQKRLDSIIAKTNRRLIEANQIPPVKTERGILVGDVLIESEGSIKHLYKLDQLVFKNVSLNAVAIRLANLLTKNSLNTEMYKLYDADQVYGKWFFDSQFLRRKYEISLSKSDFDKADIFWARYNESRDKAIKAKQVIDSLLYFN